MNQGFSFDATSKAKVDVSTIAMRHDYLPLDLFRYDDNGESDESQIARIDGITAGVNPGDLIVHQYPSLNSYRFENHFIDQMHLRGISVIIFIHDVDTWRFPYIRDQFDEMAYFNKADGLIVHGQPMAERCMKKVSPHPWLTTCFWITSMTNISGTNMKSNQRLLSAS